MRTRQNIGIERILHEFGEVWLYGGEIVDKDTADPDRLTKRRVIKTPTIRINPDRWTVYYHATNGQTFSLSDVKYYEIQDALMELSRIAYENETECDYINIV